MVNTYTGFFKTVKKVKSNESTPSNLKFDKFGYNEHLNIYINERTLMEILVKRVTDKQNLMHFYTHTHYIITLEFNVPFPIMY